MTLWLGRAKSPEKGKHIPMVGAGETTCGRGELVYVSQGNLGLLSAFLPRPEARTAHLCCPQFCPHSRSPGRELQVLSNGGQMLSHTGCKVVSALLLTHPRQQNSNNVINCHGLNSIETAMVTTCPGEVLRRSLIES